MSEKIKITYGADTVVMTWDGGRAEAEILIDGRSTGYNTADARHRTGEAVRLAADRVWPEAGGFGVGSEAWDDLEYGRLECACDCGCDLHPTTTDEGGNEVCEDCSSYTTDEDGTTHCSREHDGETCPHCSGAIRWYGIETGQSGSGQPNTQSGECSCGEWLREDRGGWTVPGYTRRAPESRTNE